MNFVKLTGFVLLNLFFIVPAVIFYRRRNEEIIRKRLPSVTMAAAVHLCIVSNYAFGTATKSFDDIPCFVICAFHYFITTPIMLFQVLRLTYLVNIFYVTRAKLEISGSTLKSALKLNLLERALLYLYSLLCERNKDENTTEDQDKILNDSTINEEEINNDVAVNEVAQTTLVFVKKHGSLRLRNLPFIEITFFAMASATYGLSILVAQREFDLNLAFSECTKEIYASYNIVFWALIAGYLIILPAIIHVLRSIHDDLWLKKETVIELLICVPCLIFYFSMAVIGQLNLAFIGTLLITIGYNLTSIVIPLFLSYKQHVKSKITKASFEQKLRDKTFMDKFKIHLSKCFCLESGLFYEEYLESQRRVQAIPPGQKQIRDIVLRKSCHMLYRKYVKNDSEFELNIPSRYRKAVEKSLKEGQYHLALFEDIATEIVELMYTNFLPTFLMKSEEI